jgi:hybrid cluster-associated redox disulfide protein
MSGKISRDMSIGEVVQKYPSTAPIIMSYGLHCVGCHVAAWETLEQGCRGHGMPEEMIDEMIAEINEYLQEEQD